ncbi:Ig-like domain-containing protein [Pontiellaceae bacterium B12227]|nr:Ig-like domain-containing protein [Pontiellaceae bacterium B12227]
MMKRVAHTKMLLALFAFFLLMPVFGEDKSNSILLVHAGQLNTDNGAYPNDGDESYFSYWNYSDGGIQYAAEYLKGMLNLIDGYADLEVDFYRATAANSLADVYYDPEMSGVKDLISSGYKYVVFFDSEQAYAYPEVMYEACSRLSQLVLDNGGTPMLMMYRSDHVDTQTLGEYCYRAANGAGIEVIPASYAYDVEGVQGRLYAAGYTSQAMINASMIIRMITGVRAETLNYDPTFEHAGIVNIYDNLSAADISRLTELGADTVDGHKTNTHYTTSYENDGAVAYRNIDVSGEPFNDYFRYYYKGSSTHEFTANTIGDLVAGTASLTSTVIDFGNQTYSSRFWTTNDTAAKVSVFSNENNANIGLFLFASGSDPGAMAQPLIDAGQPNMVPMVFDWIKAFESTSGTTATTHALNGEDCADLWFNYHFRGWKTIPLTIGMGRLNEAIPNFSASDDALHVSVPLRYMNASMMLASSFGQQIVDTAALSANNATAVTIGHDLIKELAYMSETSAHVPDSDLSVVSDSLPDGVVGVPYTNQLAASGGDGAYTWEVISSAGLPAGLALSSAGLLSGAAYEEGTYGVAFKVTDGTGAFRKVGLRLTIDPNTELPVAHADSITLLENTTADILLTGVDSEGSSSNLTYEVNVWPANGTLSGRAPDLTYTPNAGFVGEDSFTFTVSDGVNVSVPATVSIAVGPTQTMIEFVDLNAALSGNTLMADGSTNDVTVSGAASGFDYVYSINHTGSDFDYDGANDTLTFNVRVKSWTGGTTELGMDLPGSTNGASATIGTTSAQVTINNNRFSVNGNTMPEGACLEFIVENPAVYLTDVRKFGTAVMTGFNGVRLIETHNGHSHQTIFGEGTGLLGWDWNGPFNVSDINVGTGSLYVSSDTSAGTNTRPFHWGVGNVDFGINVSVHQAGAPDTVISGDAGQMTLSWTAGSGISYCVLATTNLVDGPWVEVTNGISGNDDLVSVTNALLEGQQFFRIDYDN